MATYRHVISIGLLMFVAPLGGCVEFDPMGAASHATEPGMVARAPETGNLPADPNDELALGKQHYRDRSFGLAEHHFRLAVEKSSSDAEAWLGLAASHDQLGRFDLADREYAQVVKKAGTSFELLNNRGYSYMMRGDFNRARRDFVAAQRLDPDSEFVRNNLRTLDEKASARG
jgi:Flp pilus assembly protein TadD